jgi:hypothetical protein
MLIKGENFHVFVFLGFDLMKFMERSRILVAFKLSLIGNLVESLLTVVRVSV